MTRPPEKSLLMLCYHYLPVNNGGVERSVKFAKHLPQYGWSPVIVTTNVHGVQPAEKERRIFTWELLSVYRRLLKKARKVEEGENSGTLRTAAGGKLKRAVLELVVRLLVPDLHVGWIVFAFWPAWRSLHRGETDAIYTTSPPVSPHLLGLALKKLSGKPWVMDLRDPWTFEPLNKLLHEPGIRLSLEKGMERLCFEHADAIILNTPEAAERYKQLYPRCAGKMRIITNGFDGEELEQAATLARLPLRRDPDGDVFTISHVGAISRDTSGQTDPTPHALLEAFEELLKEDTISARGCHVIFAGDLDPRIRSRITELGLDELIEAPGTIPHLKAVNLMLRSDLLLLLDTADTGQTYVRGKLYEYLGSGKLVLGILPVGASRELLKRSGQGLLVSPGDREGVRQAIVEAMRGEHRSTPAPDFKLAAYERKQLTGLLADTLERVSSTGDL